MKYKLLIIFTFLFGKIYSENIDYQFINFCFGGNYGFNLDKSYSPNIYNKIGGSFGLGYKNRNKNRIINISSNFDFKITSYEFIPKYDNRFSEIYLGELSLSYLFYLGNHNIFKDGNPVYFGLETYNNISISNISISNMPEYYNNPSNFSYFLDFAPILETDFNFEILEKIFVINYSLSVPLIGYALRSDYSNPYHYTDGIYFLGNYFRINSMSFLEFDIKNTSKFSIGYRWQYLHHKSINKIQTIDYYIILKFSYSI